VTNIDDLEVLVKLARDLVMKDFPPGEIRDNEIDKYNNMLMGIAGHFNYN
jgi:hypothetical protein